MPELKRFKPTPGFADKAVKWALSVYSVHCTVLYYSVNKAGEGGSSIWGKKFSICKALYNGATETRDASFGSKCY